MHYVPGTALSSPHNCQFNPHDNPETVCTCILQVRRQSTEKPKNVSSHFPGGRGAGPELGRPARGPQPLTTALLLPQPLTRQNLE